MKGNDKLNREDEIRLEKYKLAAQIQDNYNNLFWYRTSVFFAIIAALFAGYGLVSTEVLKHGSIPLEVTPLIGVLVAFGVAGALLSWYWLQMHKRAVFLQEYYRRRAGAFEERLEVKPDMFGETYRMAAESKPKRGKMEELDEKTKNVLKEVFGEEWKKTKMRDAGSLRERLNEIYKVFIIVWSFLSLLGVLVWLQTLLLSES